MCELLEKAKEKSGLSYYGIAKEIGASKELVSKWKLNKGKPNGEHTLALAILADVSTRDALKLLQSGYSTLSLMLVTGTLSIALLALKFSSLGMYIMLNSKLLEKTRLWIFGLYTLHHHDQNKPVIYKPQVHNLKQFLNFQIFEQKIYTLSK
jgi:transcriptional regulator with XRE-family HTH domain